MRELVDLHVETHRREVFEMGVAVNAAMADNPRKALGRILNPPKQWTYEELHPMLRAVAKPKKIAQTSP